jgi:hypothetical protein
MRLFRLIPFFIVTTFLMAQHVPARRVVIIITGADKYDGHKVRTSIFNYGVTG